MIGSAHTPSDAELWLRLCSGDEDSLAEIYSRHGSLVYSICLRVLQEPALAEDATQEVFLNLWRRRRGWDPAKGRFAAWLATSARNRAIDMVRSRRSRTAKDVELDDGGDVAAASDPWEALVEELERDAVQEALRDLPPGQQEVIDLAYWQGYTHRDISARLDLPLGTVKGRMRLALEKLQSYLDARGVQR